MRHWFVCLFATVSVNVFAQEVIKEHQLPEKHVLDAVELLSIGDTLIVNMFSQFKGSDRPETYLLTQDKSFVSIPDLHDANESPICGIVPVSGGIKRIFYVDQQKKRFSITARDADLKSGSMTGVPGELVLEGRLLNMFTNDNRVVVFSFDKGTVHEMIVEGLNISSRKKYVLPSIMATVQSRDVTLGVEGDYVGSVEAKSKLKIFVSAGWITAIHDTGGYGIPSAQTVIARYDRKSGRVASRTFTTETETNISTTILDTLIYRTINSMDVFKLEVFDLNSAKKIHEHKITLPKNEEQKVFFREGKAIRIGKNETLKNMMKTSPICEPFVIAQHQRDSSLITWGTYFDENTTSAAVGPDPFVALMTMLVTSSISRTMPGPGVSRYFYLSGSATGGYTLKENPDCLRMRIDSFEMAQQKEDYAKKLGYFKFNGDVIAIYYLERKDKMKLVKFAR